MTASVTDTAAVTAPAASVRAAGFLIEIAREWSAVATAWDGAARRGAATAFQHRGWLEAWYGAFAHRADIEPRLVTVRNRATGELALCLPLIRRRRKGMRFIEFADLDLTDYNAPLLGPAAPRDASSTKVMWRQVRRALDGDVLRVRKMPLEIEGRPNPLALLPAAGASSLNGNIVAVGEDYDAWRFSLERTVRKELERSWRVFTRDPQARFEIVADKAKALHLLSTMEMQQGERMQQLGANYILNDESCAAFYRNLVANDIGGYATLSALISGEEVVAALLGIRRGDTYIMVRISNAGEKWSNCSPGRLIIERTMAALHQDGIRKFDFSIGNYPYKRRFGVAPLPLADVTLAIGWRGWPVVLRDRAARQLRQHPAIANRIKAMIGKSPSAAAN